MKKDEIAARNLLIGAEFDKFILEHPEFLDQIPQGAQLVFLPEYDPELCRENLKLAESIREKEKPVVHIRLRKLSPQKSRIKHLTIELAKAG
ncbi:MAG: hypothetical protein HZA19_03470 [Nitrospirae bacterium]|nr:hypothetical protein [Nitrospirota bacterium]